MGPHTITVPVYSPGQLPLVVADEVQDAVTTTLNGVDPQLGNADGLTDSVIVSGTLDVAFSVTGATEGLQVNESGALPEVPVLAENLILRGFWLQDTTNESWAEAK